MNELILALMIFLEILTYMIIFDVILSWLTIFWLNIRPQFLVDIIEPLYKNIKKVIPTTFWPLDLTPIIVIFSIIFIKWVLVLMFPETLTDINNLMN